MKENENRTLKKMNILHWHVHVHYSNIPIQMQVEYSLLDFYDKSITIESWASTIH